MMSYIDYGIEGDFTHIAGCVYFIHFVCNSVVVIIVVVVVVVVVRIGCYNDYLFQVMFCLFFWNKDHENESGRKGWIYTWSKPFQLECWFFTDIIPVCAKNVYMYIFLQ